MATWRLSIAENHVVSCRFFCWVRWFTSTVSQGPEKLPREALRPVDNAWFCQATHGTMYNSCCSMGHCSREVVFFSLAADLLPLRRSRVASGPSTFCRLASKCANSFDVERLRFSFNSVWKYQAGVVQQSTAHADFCSSRQQVMSS